MDIPMDGVEVNVKFLLCSKRKKRLNKEHSITLYSL
jgi:hypothetical protein